MAWTTVGDASKVSGFGPPTAATIGLNEGNGIDYQHLEDSADQGTYYESGPELTQTVSGI